jgi:hypothetical protein
MLLEGFRNSKAHLFLRDGMEHNRFNYENDIIKPLKFFLKNHNIQIRTSKVQPERKLMKNVGFVDKKAIQAAKLTGAKIKSKYVNNFEDKFKPSIPHKDGKGMYIIPESFWDTPLD